MKGPSMAKVKKTVKVCDRDAFGKESPATTTRRFSIDGQPYRIDLCERHAEQFDRELFGWARLGVEDESYAPIKLARSENFFTAEERAAAKRAADLRSEQQPTARVMQMPAPATKPAPANHLDKVPGNHEDWVMTPHALNRAEQRGFELDEVLAAAMAPEQTYGGEKRYGPNTRIYQRGECAVAVNPSEKVIITVLHRTTGTYESSAHRSQIHRVAQ